eukprot:1172543-Prorocentrum_minimum.AAC.1
MWCSTVASGPLTESGSRSKSQKTAPSCGGPSVRKGQCARASKSASETRVVDTAGSFRPPERAHGKPNAIEYNRCKAVCTAPRIGAETTSLAPTTHAGRRTVMSPLTGTFARLSSAAACGGSRELIAARTFALLASCRFSASRRISL